MIYVQAGAYSAIMLAVVGVPQLLSSYFDHRARRRDLLENEASAERRHQDNLEERRKERREERRLEEERRRQEEERRRLDEELRRQELLLLRQDMESRSQDFERRHQEMMTLLIAAIGNGSGQVGGQGRGDIIRTLQQTIDDLRAENARLRQRNGGGDPE